MSADRPPSPRPSPPADTCPLTRLELRRGERGTGRLLFLVGIVLASTLPALAYVEERYTLPRVINESTNIVVMQVERVNKEKKLIVYKKLADLKGKHATEQIKHNVGVGGFNAFEQKAPIE